MLKYDLIAIHMHHGCVKRKGEWKDPKDGKNEKKREIRNGKTLERAN